MLLHSPRNAKLAMTTLMMAAAVLLCAFAGQASAQTHAIGRLFTTPEERYRLDMARGAADAPPAPPAPAPQAAPAPAPPPAPPLTVNGFVRRGSGPATVWVNQQDAPAALAGPRQTPQVTVTLPNGEQVRIKPGQTVDPGTGAIRDVGRP